MANKKTVTVYIGRFQPLHLGHAELIQRAIISSDLVIILVGSAYQSRTIKNPFTYLERYEMINSFVESTGLLQKKLKVQRDVEILALQDQPYNNAKWIQTVQERVNTTIANRGWDDVNIHLIGCDRDESTWYLNAFPQWNLQLETPVKIDTDLSATALRERLMIGRMFAPQASWNDVPNSTYKFLQLFHDSPEWHLLRQEFEFMAKYKKAWEAAPYAPTFVTVDAVVIQSGHVLVVERGALPGKGLWALPGGFLNQNERLQDAAIRELIEETGIKVPKQVLNGSVKAKEIFDDPARSLRGRTLTTAFLIRLDDTKPLPKVSGQNMPLHESGGKAVVETAKAFWLPINDARANSEQWFEDHHAILDTMLGMIKD